MLHLQSLGFSISQMLLTYYVCGVLESEIRSCAESQDLVHGIQKIVCKNF